MHRIALVVTSPLEGHGLSAIYRALMFAQELRDAGDDVCILFDGTGSTAAAALADPGHRLHALFADVRPRVRGVCRHCARSYGVLERIEAAGLPLAGEHKGHASLRALLEEGRQIVTV
jgi:sulfur relay (sulfurtransferase) complex TusBCD TusD component (DsrE family)